MTRVVLRAPLRGGGPRDDDVIVTAYVVIAETRRALEHRDRPQSRLPDATVLMVAVVAAQHFRNHHALASATLQRQGYRSGR